MDRKTVFPIFVGLVACMVVHASEGLFQGKAPSEVHLITSAPLVPVAASTASTAAMDYVQHNAITTRFTTPPCREKVSSGLAG